MIIPRFLNPTNSFHAELRKRINDYFVEIKSKPTGNIKLYSKAIILVVSFIAVYTHLIFFTSENLFISLTECLILGTLTSAIGFNIMHDGAHGSFSQQKWLNELAGLSLNVLGANVFMWKTKHNVVHHTFTNIEGMDDDINAKPFLRLCESQKRYKIHKFQHLYFLVAYSLLYIYWIFFTDYKKYFSKRVGQMPIKKMSVQEHFSFWGFKALHLILFVVIPIIMVGFTAWVIGFLTYGLFAGIVLSLVFQLAHTVSDTHFPTVNAETGKVEDEWAVHQLKTTANFATKNKIVSWFTGGLNFQIEHHLFPHISHIHYPAISEIVKQACREYNIPYIEYPKVRLAVASHISHLKSMGRV
ncbi:MAG: acyl-CoA desaturase [Bacteroidia bacterium]|nr:acyl-CoA desaturase [Bacteroidia bacterium]